jgi:ELWxxDGT repeat protein
MRADVFASFAFYNTHAPAFFPNRCRRRRGAQRVGIACSAVVQELEPRVLLAASSIHSFNPGQSVHGGVTMDGVTYYDAYQGPRSTIYQLMRSDGTPGGTYTLTEFGDTLAGWDPADFFNFNGTLYYESIGGLCKSDGTIAGTSMVFTSTSAHPSFTQVGSELYFFGTDNSGNENLYKTDGTLAGPTLVQTLQTSVPSTPQVVTPSMANLNGTLYFTTPDLWKLDANGQPELIESFGDQNRAGGELMAVNDTLYLKAQDPNNPYQLDLWESDGTTAGTKVLWTDGISNLPGTGDFFAFNNDLYFVTDSSASGYQLHRTDGTVSGTTLLTLPGFTFNTQVGFTVADGKLFFAASSGPSTGATIWTSDGTAAGTTPIADPSIGVTSMLPGSGVLYFISDKGELYETDGTSTALADPSESSAGWVANRLLGQSAGGLVFGATDSSGNETTWVLPAPATLPPAASPPPAVAPPPFTPPDTTISFGTPVSLQVVSTNPSPGETSFGPGISIGGIVYYAADDVVHGWQVWKTDGTAAGTSMVSDINASGGGAYPSDFTDFNGTLYFIAMIDINQNLYKTDGTPGGTTLIATNVLTVPPVQVGNELYFIANDSASGGTELYKTDGTTAGTTIIPGVFSYGGYWFHMVTMGGNLYIEDLDSILKVMPNDQTQVVATLPAPLDIEELDQYELFATDNAIYFTDIYPDENSSSLALYKNDGTPGGTSVVLSSGIPRDTDISAVALGDDLIFATQTSTYRTDGTVAGTFAIGSASTLTAVGSHVFFTQGSDNFNPDDPGSAAQLWVTDGTLAGTRIAEPSVGVGSALVNSENDSLYSVGSDSQVYQTDGTVTAWIDPLASPDVSAIGGLIGLSANGVVFCNGDQLWALSTQAAPPPGPTTSRLPPSPPPVSAIAPTLGRISLVGQLVAGSKLNAHVPVIVSNRGTSISGKITVKLIAEKGTSPDGTQVLLSTKTRRVRLKADQKAVFLFDVKSLPATLQGGTYHLIAEVIDPRGDTNTIATSQTVQVQTRFVRPSVSFASVTTATLAPGKRGSVIVTVTNTGNTSSTGGTITLSLSSDSVQPSAGVTLKTVHAGLAISAGKTLRYRIRFRVPADTMPMNYSLNALVSFDGSSETALGSSSIVIRG